MGSEELINLFQRQKLGKSEFYPNFCFREDSIRKSMLVDLDQGALESIVRDGVKEILGKVLGGGKGIRRNSWYTVVKAAINEYQKNLNENFLPVLKQDFGRKMTIKFSGGKMNDEDKNKLKMFMEMVKKSNVTSVKEELYRKFDNLKIERKNAYRSCKQVKIIQICKISLVANQ